MTPPSTEPARHRSGGEVYHPLLSKEGIKGWLISDNGHLTTAILMMVEELLPSTPVAVTLAK